MTARQIGQALRDRRKGIELSQSAAGALAAPPLMRKTITAIENGTGNPELASVLAYAAALGCRIAVEQ